MRSHRALPSSRPRSTSTRTTRLGALTNAVSSRARGAAEARRPPSLPDAHEESGEGRAEGGEQGAHEPLLLRLPLPLLPAELEVAGHQLREPEEPMASGIMEVLPVQPNGRGDAQRCALPHPRSPTES